MPKHSHQKINVFFTSVQLSSPLSKLTAFTIPKVYTLVWSKSAPLTVGQQWCVNHYSFIIIFGRDCSFHAQFTSHLSPRTLINCHDSSLHRRDVEFCADQSISPNFISSISLYLYYRKAASYHIHNCPGGGIKQHQLPRLLDGVGQRDVNIISQRRR